MNADPHIAPAPDRYEREVAGVAEYLAERMLRGRNLRGLIHDAACQFPGLRLGIFHDALAEVTTRAGGNAFPGVQPQ